MARGRPQIGKTRKLSLTLPEDEWMQLDKMAEGGGMSTSGVLREVVGFYLRDEGKKKRLKPYNCDDDRKTVAVTEGRSGAEDRARQGERAPAR